MIDLLICLIIALLIAGAVLAVIRALLSVPQFSGFAPYGNVIYALAVLLVVLCVVEYCFGGLPLHRHL